MQIQDQGVLTETSVRSSYLTHLREYYRRKSGIKPVSPNYLERQASKLDGPGVGGLSYWQRLARYCQSGRFDLDRLIRAFFISQDKIRNFMLLNHDEIFSQNTSRIYESLAPTPDVCTASLKAQQRALEAISNHQFVLYGTDERRSSVDALMADLTPFTPLFRCCVLNKYQEDFRPWLLSAIQQYQSAPDSYDKSWGDLIPQDIREIGKNRRSS